MKKVIRWIQFNYPNIARGNYEVFDDNGDSLGGKDFDLDMDSLNSLKSIFSSVASKNGCELPEEKKAE